MTTKNRMNAKEYRAMQKKQKPSKYRNKRTEVDGILFDSMAEAERYRELKLLEKQGEIFNLELQHRFLLQADYTNDDGKKVGPIYYVCDFKYRGKDGKLVVEDVKGMKTPVYKLKKKLFEFKYKIPIVEIQK